MVTHRVHDRNVPTSPGNPAFSPRADEYSPAVLSARVGLGLSAPSARGPRTGTWFPLSVFRKLGSSGRARRRHASVVQGHPGRVGTRVPRCVRRSKNEEGTDNRCPRHRHHQIVMLSVSESSHSRKPEDSNCWGEAVRKKPPSRIDLMLQVQLIVGEPGRIVTQLHNRPIPGCPQDHASSSDVLLEPLGRMLRPGNPVLHDLGAIPCLDRRSMLGACPEGGLSTGVAGDRLGRRIPRLQPV